MGALIRRAAPRGHAATINYRDLDEHLNARPDRATRLLQKLGGKRVVLPNGTVLWRLIEPKGGRGPGDWVVEVEGPRYDVHPVEEYLYQVDVDTVFPREEERFHAEFWESPPELYHATTKDNVRSIERQGLNPTNRTRGIGNRWTGPAVFTTTELDEAAYGTYGPVVFRIDTEAMKRARYTPPVAEEEPVREYNLRQWLAHRLEAWETHFDLEQGLSLHTVVVFGTIPAKYLTQV